MKKALLFSLLVPLTKIVSAQQELQIHHINIENGDATMIGVYRLRDKSYTTKVLIDGGQSAAGLLLLSYLQRRLDLLGHTVGQYPTLSGEKALEETKWSIFNMHITVYVRGEVLGHCLGLTH